MGRRQGGVGEASPLCFFGRGQSEDASPTHHSRIDLDMIVAVAKGGLAIRISKLLQGSDAPPAKLAQSPTQFRLLPI